ncbi:MAG TPA: hypothetical protein VNA25_14140 [Phycisphaerae bacterium]|nr:hypothetical protein [Phycisphaerae bacterium]
MALAEWHVTPDYIVNNWSEDLFALMVKKRNERMKNQAARAQGGKVTQVTVRDLKPNWGENTEDDNGHQTL